MQKNGFLKQFTIIGGGTFFNLLLGLFSTPVITRIVAPSEYGQLSIFTMYSGIALMVLCMGLDQAVVRYYYEKENLKYKQALLFRCIVIPIIASLIITIIVMAMSLFHIVNFEFDSLIMYIL